MSVRMGLHSDRRARRGCGWVGCGSPRPWQAVNTVHCVRRQYSQYGQHRQSCPETRRRQAALRRMAVVSRQANVRLGANWFNQRA
ncbi:MAG: hypothetical protein WCP62_14985, partial [Planctomycetota bacterium]